MLLLLLITLLPHVLGGELGRCCRQGERHFVVQKTCAGLVRTGSDRCIRASSICCIRSLSEFSCKDGEKLASDGTCPVDAPDRLGGASEKECCDCCLLAKELLESGLPCSVPATQFGSLCKETLRRCCNNFSTSLSPLFADGRPNRCARSPCEQLCEDRGGPEVSCFCRPGFALGSDSRSCRAISAGARSFGLNTCVDGYTLESDGSCKDRDECAELEAACPGANQNCLNYPGGFDCQCLTGFTWNAQSDSCVDIDECHLLIDNCLETQQCYNTPGSYRCIRTLSCGTGYTLQTDSDSCMDVDECQLGTHDCGPTYHCRNTQGSFRCETKSCPPGHFLNSNSGSCVKIDCAIGFEPDATGNCKDVNECVMENRCAPFQRCVNSPGSYRCESQPNFCGSGYRVDGHTGGCVDIDECSKGTHTCQGQQACINQEGSFRCNCQEGYDFNLATKQCEDMDECVRSAGHVCSIHGRCENIPGSFRCHCNAGFQLAPDGRTCIDIDECNSGAAHCQQRCINIPGSYQCICNRGYALGVDGTTCEDIDECRLWSGAGTDLCMGGCVNTPGSYTCQCPEGYEMESDGRTCKDIDECARGECQGSDRICLNTLGSYKCHLITCPKNYVQDSKFKHRCNRPFAICLSGDRRCQEMPMTVTHRYIALARLTPFPSSVPSVPLFTMKGPTVPTTQVQFELVFRDAVARRSGVRLATRNSFLLQKGDRHNKAIISLREPLDGPQEIQLDLVMRVYHSGIFGGKAVAHLGVIVSGQERPRNTRRYVFS